MPNIAYLDFTYDKSSIMTEVIESPFTITSREDNNTFTFTRATCPTGLKISLDGGISWSYVSYTDNLQNDPYRLMGTINKGETIMLCGNVSAAYSTQLFSSTGDFDLSGNILSLNTLSFSNTNSLAYESQYKQIFKQTRVVDASKLILPATALTQYCYAGMFYSCTKLVYAPNLPATALQLGCYEQMFFGCTSLLQGPELPATHLKQECYYGMFQGCTSLSQAPALPALYLGQDNAEFCYGSMFRGCTSLQIAPVLNSNDLAPSCYRSMFRGCTSLSQAPELPASVLVSNCYQDMFRDCTNLSYIKIHAIERVMSGDGESLHNWVENVARYGIFIKHPSASYRIDSDHGVPLGWTIFNLDDTIGNVYKVRIDTTPSGTGYVLGAGQYASGSTVTLTGQPASGYKVKQYSIYTSPTTTEVVSQYNNSYTFTIEEDTNFLVEFEVDEEYQSYESDYFTITSLEDNNSIYFKINNPNLNNLEEDDFELSYSINNDEWQSMTITFDTESYADPDEGGWYDERHFRQNVLITTINEGDNIRFRADRDTYVNQTPESGTINISGTNRFITSKQYKVSGNVLSLLYASDNDMSSQYKFYYYRNASIPNGCFSNFFAGDQYLVDASNLIIPDVTIGTYSFYQCFASCKSLVKPPVGLYPSTLATGCYSDMFHNCISLLEAPDLPAITLADYCYREMFSCGEFFSGASNTSLIYPPELPATTLATGCYYRMFANNASLQIQPNLPATTLATACYYEMFAGCTSLIGYGDPFRYATFGDHSVTLNDSSCAGMFKNCYSITTAYLQTDFLSASCCKEMFFNCHNLSMIYITATGKYDTDWDNESNGPTYNWVENVAPQGTFYKNSNLNWPVDSNHGIPIGWTAVNMNTELWDFNVYNSNNIAGYVTKSPNTDLVTDNTEVTVTATVIDNGFTFLGWKKQDGTYASTNSTYTFTATENINLTAIWSGESLTKYTLSILNTNPYAGTATGEGVYSSGTYVTLNAIANDGWELDKWVKQTNNNTEEFSSTSVNVVVNNNMTWQVYWNPISTPEHEYFTITSAANNNKVVLMIPDGTYNSFVWSNVVLNSIEYRKNDVTYWTSSNAYNSISRRVEFTSTTQNSNGNYDTWYGIVFDLNSGETLSLRHADGYRGDRGSMWDIPSGYSYSDMWHFTLQCKYNFTVKGNIESLSLYSDYGGNSSYNYYDMSGIASGGYWRRNIFDGVACRGDGDTFTTTNPIVSTSGLYIPQ